MSDAQASDPKLPLQDRLALHALRLEEEAQALRPGPKRDAVIRRAREAENACHVHDFLIAPAASAK
jgi:hypothetical protein